MSPRRSSLYDDWPFVAVLLFLSVFFYMRAGRPHAGRATNQAAPVAHAPAVSTAAPRAQD